MKTILELEGVKLEIETAENKYLGAWEKSRAIQKFWKALNLPKASFKSNVYSWGSSLDIRVKELPTEEQKSLFKKFEEYFKEGSFNGMDDSYNYKADANIFSFKYIFIQTERGLLI